MDDLAALFFFEFKVRNLEGSQTFDGEGQRLVAGAAAAPSPQLLSDPSQGPERTRPIEPLTFTVFAEICHRMYASTQMRFQNLPRILRCPALVAHQRIEGPLQRPDRRAPAEPIRARRV
jgi:hypothetical protein